MDSTDGQTVPPPDSADSATEPGPAPSAGSTAPGTPAPSGPAAAAHGPAMPEALSARFAPESVLGAGGMGCVYLARDRRLRRVSR